MRGAPPPATSKASLGDLSPSLWRHLLFVGQPFRLAIAANVLVGRSIRSLAYDVLRRFERLLGWLFGRLRLRRFEKFERRYFLVRRWHAALAVVTVAKAVQQLARAWSERRSGEALEKCRLRAAMLEAQDFEEWSDAAGKLEQLLSVRRDPVAAAALESRLYDRRLLQQRLRALQAVRERGDPSEMMFALRSDLLRNLGNIANPDLHATHFQAPRPIRDYINEVRLHLHTISHSPTPSLEERLVFLRETRHAFGRTALVLSGGGSFGSFHLGVVKALLDAQLLPRVLSGSSAGSIVAALICTRTAAELIELFDSLPERLQGIDFYASNTVTAIFKHLLLKGTLQDHGVLQERLQRLLGEVTFAEAYARSGRILNVSVSAADTSEPPRLLNYLTAPNVIVWSAVACSSAFPLLFAPQSLLARDARGRVVPFSDAPAGEAQRRWRDGSLEEDLPMRGLSEMFNVNYFLVSQCNPYLLPIIAAKAAAPRTLGTLCEFEFKHRCKQLLELVHPGFGMAKVLKLLSQPWEGDVTMTLPASSISAVKAVVNLSRDDLLRSLAEGQRAAWAKLSAISANCDVEVALDECLKQLMASARRAKARLHRRASSTALAAAGGGGAGLRAGFPSWLHLQALGLHHSDSHDALTAGTPTSRGTNGGNGGMADGGFAAADRWEQETAVASPGVARIPSAPQVDLRATAVPEDAETTPAADDAAAVAAAIAAVKEEEDDVDAAMAVPLAADAVGIPEPDEEDDLGPGAMAFPYDVGMSLNCTDDVWKELFNVVPATTTASAASDALDYIAP